MTTKECFSLFKDDYCRCKGNNSWGGKSLIYNILIPSNLTILFCFWFRMCSSSNWIVRNISRYKRLRMTRKYGVQINPDTRIGTGMFLPHFLSIVVHPKTIIGKNLTLHQFVTIAGDNYGNAPIICDNCFIGAGATLIGGIRIGYNVTIAAGAVVVTDVPDNATVGGIPAKVIHFKHPAKYIQNPIK